MPAWIERPARDGASGAPLLRRPRTTIGRLAIAVVGWAPLGLFTASAIDQATGCGRYSASCGDTAIPLTWLAQAVILLALLAVPAVAGWSAHGAIGALIFGVPAAVALSAAGGTNVRETSGPILLGLLALAYLIGVVYAIVVGRRRLASA